jgi:hypothetical protein
MIDATVEGNHAGALLKGFAVENCAGLRTGYGIQRDAAEFFQVSLATVENLLRLYRLPYLAATGAEKKKRRSTRPDGTRPGRVRRAGSTAGRSAAGPSKS